MVLGFKLLSVGAGSQQRDLCNEQNWDSNERSNLNVDSGEKPGLALKRICKSRTQIVNQILVKESRQKHRDAIENLASTGRVQAEFLPKSSNGSI